MTRSEHMQWCKDRANEIVDSGDTNGAYASMISDIGKHDETAGHPAIELGMMLLMTGDLAAPDQMRNFIDGFN